MADIFISYKREDKHLVEDTIQRLTEAGYSVWYDDRITPSTSWDETIEAEIAAAKAVLVVWTQRSVASEWVRTEADYAREHGKMIPIKLDECSLPLAYRRVQTADLSHWDGSPTDRTWQKVLEWVRGLVTGTGTQPGGIGAAVSDGQGRVLAHPSAKRGNFMGVALLVIAVGAFAGSWATGLISTEKISNWLTPPSADAEPERANQETAADEEAPTDDDSVATSAEATPQETPAPEPTRPAVQIDPTPRVVTQVQPTRVPDPEPEPIACFEMIVMVSREDSNNNNWDVGPGAFAYTRPDVRLTSASHPNVSLSCENSFQCRGGPFENTNGDDTLTVLVLDDDNDENDLIGQGNCPIPARNCPVGNSRVSIREAECSSE